MPKDLTLLWKVVEANKNKWLSASEFFNESDRLKTGNHNPFGSYNSVCQCLRGMGLHRRAKYTTGQMEYYCP
ncbi:MAG: hypothetical protein ABID38_05780 [Candidatus Diapherotrites archaeon]